MLKTFCCSLQSDHHPQPSSLNPSLSLSQLQRSSQPVTKLDFPPPPTTTIPCHSMSLDLLIAARLVAEVFSQDRPTDISFPSAPPATGSSLEPDFYGGITMTRNFVSHLVNFYKDQGLWSEALEECLEIFQEVFSRPTWYRMTRWFTLQTWRRSAFCCWLEVVLISRQNKVWPASSISTQLHSRLHWTWSVVPLSGPASYFARPNDKEIRPLARLSPLTGRPKLNLSLYSN